MLVWPMFFLFASSALSLTYGLGLVLFPEAEGPRAGYGVASIHGIGFGGLLQLVNLGRRAAPELTARAGSGNGRLPHSFFRGGAHGTRHAEGMWFDPRLFEMIASALGLLLGLDAGLFPETRWWPWRSSREAASGSTPFTRRETLARVVDVVRTHYGDTLPAPADPASECWRVVPRETLPGPEWYLSADTASHRLDALTLSLTANFQLPALSPQDFARLNDLDSQYELEHLGDGLVFRRAFEVRLPLVERRLITSLARWRADVAAIATILNPATAEETVQWQNARRALPRGAPAERMSESPPPPQADQTETPAKSEAPSFRGALDRAAVGNIEL